MTAMTRGAGPESLKAIFSQDRTGGVGMVVILYVFLWIEATPPPLPV